MKDSVIPKLVIQIQECPNSWEVEKVQIDFWVAGIEVVILFSSIC